MDQPTLVLLSAILCQGTIAGAQPIRFAPTPYLAMAEYAAQRPQVVGLCANEESTDTLMAGASHTGKPILRAEYYLDGTLFRRIEIVEELRDVDLETSAMPHEDHATKEVRLWEDVPRGRYQEYHRNGKLRVEGALDGYGKDGRPWRTGEWRTWDADGVVIKTEQLP